MTQPSDPIPPRVKSLSAYWHLLIIPIARGVGAAAWPILWFSVAIKLFLI